MIYLTFALLIIGVLFLFAESFVSRFGILGISGIVLILVSSVITVITIPFGAFIVAVEVVVLSFAIFILIQFLRKKQLYGKLALNEALNFEEKEIGDLDYFVGKEGLTKTSLRPFGTVDFNGVNIEVCSDGNYVDAQKKVVVTEVKHQKILVKAIGNK